MYDFELTFEEYQAVRDALMRKRRNLKKFLKRMKKNPTYWISDMEDTNEESIKDTEEKIAFYTKLIKKIRGY